MQLLDECYFQDVEKIKTIGSSYMAASGLSPDREVCEDDWHHLSELVLFALAMQETLSHINTHTGNSFQLRVGTHRASRDTDRRPQTAVASFDSR